MQFLVARTRVFIACFVQGGRWANYNDGMTFEDECRVVVEWWRRLNRSEASPANKDSRVKLGFVPSILLLKKAVLAAHCDGGNAVPNRIRTRSTACV